MLWLVAMVAVASGTSSLRIVEHVDPISDAQSVYAVVGTGDEHLAIGCDDVRDHSIRVVAHFNRYVGDATPGIFAGGTEVQYRFDQRPPAAVRWYSHEREVTAEAQITRPLKFALEMKGSTSIYLRAINFDGEPIDMGFTYDDATPTIEQMLTSCGLNSDGSKPKDK